ncbi:hypothetical protein D3C78_1389160 [compost metagenome]
MTLLDFLRLAYRLQLIYLNRRGINNGQEAVKIIHVTAVHVRAPMIGQPNRFMNMNTDDMLLYRIHFPCVIIKSHSLHHHAVAKIIPKPDRGALHAVEYLLRLTKRWHLVASGPRFNPKLNIPALSGDSLAGLLQTLLDSLQIMLAKRFPALQHFIPKQRIGF